MEALDVVVLGAIGIDTSVFLYGADIDFSVEGNFSENLDNVGQAGGYSSRGFAQLGHSTGFIGYVGQDHHGGFVTDELVDDGVEVLLFIDPQGTRRSVNFMYRDGRRKNFYDGKGAMNVSPDLAACREMLRRTRLAHFSIENWARYLLQPARELGVTIACDLQDMVSLEDEYRRDFIQAADILFFSGTNFADPAAVIAQLLRERPERIVVVGLGSQGAALGSRDGIKFLGPVQLDLPLIDTNGAGDGLAVGFLSSYCLGGYSLEESVLRGQITARYTCAQRASTAHLISRAQLDAYFERLKPR